MRRGEILMVMADLAAFLVFIYRPVWAGRFAVIVLGVLITHIFTEKSHWQMIPAYLASLAIVGCGFFGIARAYLVTSAGFFLAAVMLFASVLLAIVLPVFSLPQPSGPYSIGTVTRVWTRTHSHRDPNELVSRRLRVQFWYPAQTGNGKRSPYRTEVRQGLKSHLRLVRTHSLMNARFLPGTKKLPIVLYSPGWKGHLTQNSVQFEMLSSHGFVVVSVEHPPAEALPADFDPSLEENLREYPFEARLRADDLSFLIDQIQDLNRNDPEGIFTAHLDTSRVGIFGYSFGGAVAAETCWLDQRLKAGINMDGMMFGAAADAGVMQPFFFMSCDGPLPTQEDLQCPDPRRRLHMQSLDLDITRIRRSLATYGGYYLNIRGSAHSNYSDRPLYSPLRKLTDAGAIDVKKVFEIINDYTLAFFEQYLNEHRQDLLKRDARAYPEAEFEFHPIPSSVSAPEIA